MDQFLRLKGVVVLLVCAAAIACGGGGDDDDDDGGNPFGPGGSGTGSCSSFGPLGGARGSITANISGFGAFNGGISPGNSVYTPIAAIPSLGLPAQDTISINGVCGDLKQVLIVARAITGTINIGVDANGNFQRDPQTQQPWVHSVMLSTVANGVASGLWVTNLTGGSGTITLNSVSPSSVSGSFSVTMIPSPGSGATGNRTMSGSFNATF